MSKKTMPKKTTIEDELLDSAATGNTEVVARILATGVSAKVAADAIQSAVFAGRHGVIDQIQQWSITQWGQPLLNQAALLDLVASAQWMEGGEDPALDQRLEDLKSIFESLGGSSPGQPVSYALAGGLADQEEVEPHEEPVLFGFPERGLRCIPAQKDLPLGAPKNGVEYFVGRMFETHPEWSVLAFKATAGDIVPRLMEFLELTRWVPDAADQILAEAGSEYFLLQLRDHQWSLLLTLSLPRGPRQLASLAQRISAHLDVPTVAFAYEETGGSSVTQLFESGHPGTEARQRRSWPPFFRKLGLFVPFFGLQSEEGRTELILEGLERSQVESLHFLA